MGRGEIHASESKTFQDRQSGARVRQVTDQPVIHHHPFYYIPAHDDRMNFLFFVSHRTGRPEIFAEIQETWEILQLTECDALGEWSVHPSHDGRYVYFTDGASACRVHTETFEQETLLHFGDVEMREKGMVGAAMGTTTLSRDDRWWGVPVKMGENSRFFLIDTQTGTYEIILERDTIGHPQFHPDDPGLLRYAGPYHERIWVIGRDGRDNRLVYRRNQAKREWIVHETWIPGTKEIATTNWPHGMFAINVDTGAIRPICSFNAWHPMVNREGNLMVCDTKNPDIGLQVFSPSDGEGNPRPLCLSESSNEGEHWNVDHCPYDDGTVKGYAPQHTHPHPNFSPDGKKVVFTSDRSGSPQVYEVEVSI